MGGKGNWFWKIGFEKESFVEIANHVSLEWALLRKRILPEHLEFLAKNKRYEYPQKIYEVVKTVKLAKTETGVKEKKSMRKRVWKKIERMELLIQMRQDFKQKSYFQKFT